MALRKLFNVGKHNGLRLKPAAPSAVSVRSAQDETTEAMDERSKCVH
jgi:hypothetical protein